MPDFLYCTVRDVRNALTPGADVNDKATASGLADWQLTDAIVEAMGHVKAFIGAIYSIVATSYTEDTDAEPETSPVPFTAGPDPIRGWTRDIAAFLATLTFKRNKDVTPDDPVRLRFNLAMSQLTAIRDGKTTIDLPPATDVDGNGAVTVVNQYEGHLFGPEDFGIGVAGSCVSVWPYRGSSGW